MGSLSRSSVSEAESAGAGRFKLFEEDEEVAFCLLSAAAAAAIALSEEAATVDFLATPLMTLMPLGDGETMPT